MLGLDIGGTKIELAIFDDQIKLVESWRSPTPKTDYEDFLATITEMVATADKKRGIKESVGVGIPGFVDKNARFVSSNVPCLNGQRPSVDLSRRLDRPVGIDNDTKNFVYSEANGGAGTGSRYVLGIILGTGVAGSFCVDGELFRGANGLAGEYGHIALPAALQRRYDLPLRQCGCGNAGCVEAYLSGPGLLWMSEHFGGSFETVSVLMDAVRTSNATAETAFSTYINCLGMYLMQMALVFDPDVVILGGGLSNVPEIFDRLPEAIRKYLVDGFVVPPVVQPRFGDSSGVRGAAMIGSTARDEAQG